jgi:hypothetical protein
LQILENSGRYWDTSILVIPVLQILEDLVWSCGMYFYIGGFSTQIFQILHITFVFRFSFHCLPIPYPLFQ